MNTVIDVHCHIYPEPIKEKAVRSVGQFYNISMDVTDGSAEALLASCAGSPIGRHVVHSVALSPHQVTSINDFIAAQCAAHPQFTGFFTLHQDFPNPEQEIERALSMGLVGLKLHPDSQQVDMDDPRLMAIYEMAEGHFPIIMHCGDCRYDFSHPRRMQKILRRFPKLVVDAAHFGGWSIYDLAVEYLENENCYLDMSSAQAFLGPRRTAELVRIYGTDRILFGSDFPMWNPVVELDAFSALPFTSEELEAMTSKNAQRFLSNQLPR